MRSLVEQHPVLLATGAYLWCSYFAAVTVFGREADKMYDQRMGSWFSRFLMPSFLSDRRVYVSGQRVTAGLVWLFFTWVYVSFLARTCHWEFPWMLPAFR